MASPASRPVKASSPAFNFRPFYKNSLDIAPLEQMHRNCAFRASRAFGVPRANWDTPQTRLLLELTMQEKEKGNFSHQTLTRDGWRNVYHHGLRQGNVPWSERQARNKLNALKDKFNIWKELQNCTGLGRDPSTGGAAADEEWWPSQDGTQPATQDEVIPLTIPAHFVRVH